MFAAKDASPLNGGGEVELRPRREVVDDLQHRRALVAACPPGPAHDLEHAAPACGHVGGRSPVACRAARLSTPSERTPTFTPVPSMP